MDTATAKNNSCSSRKRSHHHHQDAHQESSSSSTINTSIRLPLLRAKRRVESADTSFSPANNSDQQRLPPVVHTDRHNMEQQQQPPPSVSVVTDRYEKLSRIGRGSYGIVYKARDTETNRIVALKRCVLWPSKKHGRNATTRTTRTRNAATTANDHQQALMTEPHADDYYIEDVPVVTLREIETLRLCASCPYIVSLLDVAVSSSSVFLVLNYCDYDLADLIDAHYHQQQRGSPFTEAACKTLLIHLLSALNFLHEHYILHRDVKMSNLLYSTTHNNGGGGRLQLTDFGLSRHYYDSTTTTNRGHHATTVVTGLYDPALTPKVASLWYRPPEVLLACPTYSCAMDIWAAGCAWVELLTGQPAMAGTNELEQIQLLFDTIGVPDEPRDFPLLANGTVQLPTTATTTAAPGAYAASSRRKFQILDRVPFLADSGSQLLISMLQIAPSQRWTAKEALRSPYFTDHPLPLPERQMPRLFSVTTS
jgi:cyclin-dependent kinase 10